jgi:hypothetical protein
MGAKRGPVSAATRATIAAKARERWARVRAGELPKPNVGAKKQTEAENFKRSYRRESYTKPMIARCALCDWTAAGLSTDVLAAQREHAESVHGVTPEHRDELRRARR